MSDDVKVVYATNAAGETIPTMDALRKMQEPNKLPSNNGLACWPF